MGLKVFGWLLLGGLLVASGWLALSVAPSRVPEPGAETTNWLAASSLALDGDLRFTTADTDRFRERFRVAPKSVVAAGDAAELEAPPLASRLWAAGSRWASGSGPFVMQWFCLAVALGLAALVLGPTLGDAAALWVAVLGFGSVLFRSAFQLLPELPALTGMMIATTCVWWRRAPPAADAAQQIFEGERPERPALLRWLGAGAALGAVAVRDPLYLLIALPMLVDLPRARRASAGALFAVGLALPVALVAATEGLPWAAPSGVFTAALFGWNALFALAGASAGILVWFPPLLMLLAFARRPSPRDGRSWLPLAVLAAFVAQILLHPFDWAGDRVASGNAWFVPLYGALWLALDPKAGMRSRPVIAAFVTLGVGLPFLLPVWLAPVSPVPVPPAGVRPALEKVRALLPFETTLREVPGSLELRRGGVRLRTIDAGVVAERGRLAWAGSRSATLWLESDRPLESVTFELGEQAPSALDIRGGASGETTFRPDGGISFEVALARPARAHPLWWSHAPASIYRTQMHRPDEPQQPIAFDLGVARPHSEPAPGGAEP